MALDDPLTNRKTDAGSGVFAVIVQALEDAEHPIRVLRQNTYAVVFDANAPLIVCTFCSDVDARRLIVAAVLDGVSDEVLEYMLYLTFPRRYGRKNVMRDFGLRLLNCRG